MKPRPNVKDNPKITFKRLFSLLFLFTLLSACAPSDIVIEGSLPIPMVKKIPVRIGVHYPDAFANFVYTETSKEFGAWLIDLGKQNAGFFRALFGSMFTEAVILEKWDVDIAGAPNENTQAVLSKTADSIKVTYQNALIEKNIAISPEVGKQLLLIKNTLVNTAPALIGIFWMTLFLINAMIFLLYTSDAADEKRDVDLGGRRNIKKK